MSFDLNYIATLANLTLSEEEKQSVHDKMENILHFVEIIQELELGEYEVSVNSYDMPTVLREDNVGETMNQQNLQQNLPKCLENHIIVPQVIQK